MPGKDALGVLKDHEDEGFSRCRVEHDWNSIGDIGDAGEVIDVLLLKTSSNQICFYGSVDTQSSQLSFGLTFIVYYGNGLSRLHADSIRKKLETSFLFDFEKKDYQFSIF